MVKRRTLIQENPSRDWRQESVKTERRAVAFRASVQGVLQVRNATSFHLSRVEHVLQIDDGFDVGVDFRPG